MIPKIKEVQEALQELSNDLVLVNDQILDKETGNPVKVNTDHNGYQYFNYKGLRFYYHRIVFFLHSGLWPDMVDHIDHDKANNHPTNLRAATALTNAHNKRCDTASKTGLKGVYLTSGKKKKPYRAMIMFQGKAKHIGYFDTAEQATYAYDVFAKVCFQEFAALHDEDRFYQRVGAKIDEIEKALLN